MYAYNMLQSCGAPGRQHAFLLVLTHAIFTRKHSTVYICQDLVRAGSHGSSVSARESHLQLGHTCRLPTRVKVVRNNFNKGVPPTPPLQQHSRYRSVVTCGGLSTSDSCSSPWTHLRIRLAIPSQLLSQVRKVVLLVYPKVTL
ncbi:hypothetical protein Hamer_G019367 [Homarus americanus]|uniref:Uncharacterized protein n=1 Tax=Homarus americanus TaxID=6706 RepID=A0A8J5MSL2_HOMAM|nr:hypothetical protein Hamer_G019367 [Homarus americanus]